MEIKWHNPEASFERLVLAGDIGGTNSNLALVGEKDGRFTLILETVTPSHEITDLSVPLREILARGRERRADLVPERVCISAAGPVSGNVCVMTNLPWTVDGPALQAVLGIPALVINDFLAISYGIPTLDVNDPAQIHPIRHPDGSTPAPLAATKAVIGPGTGLGVSFLVWDGHRHIPASSEGGHMTFAPFDADSQAFRDYLQRKNGAVPGVEPLVSGTGMRNLYHFWKDTKGTPDNEAWQTIEATPDHHRPKALSIASDKDETAAELMRLFVRLLGRFAGDVSTLLMPLGGLYLAGGVAQKELRWLERDDLFAQAFESSHNPNVRAFLRQVPLYLIKDYSISLYGAANAGLQLA